MACVTPDPRDEKGRKRREREEEPAVL